MGYNRSELRAKVRQRLGWPSTDSFVVDAELNDMIADSTMELWDLLATMHGSGFMAEENTLTTVAGTASYDLSGMTTDPVGRIIRVHCDLGGSVLTPFKRGDLGVHVFSSSTQGWSYGSEVTYFLRWQGDITQPWITFDPAPQAVHSVSIWLQDRDVILADDVTDNPLGHDEYIVLDTAIKCRVKEEGDASALMAQKDAYQARLERLARPVDVGQPPTISDARSAFGLASGSREESWWWR